MERSLKSMFRIYFFLAALAFALPAQSETLRCNGRIIEAGESKVSVRYHCGEPLLKDVFCAPLYFSPSFRLVPEPFASTIVPCQQIEEWLYDRGVGNLVATVRFRTGVVLSINYGARALE